jgi:hypothetical protein
MVTPVGELIQVGAIFGSKTKVRPVWFVWRGREYRVREVTYSWKEREGKTLIQHFSVTDGVSLYDLSYHTAEMNWYLSYVEDGS